MLLWPNLSFMIISCALFGLALGGLFEMLATDRVNETFTVARTALRASGWMTMLLALGVYALAGLTFGVLRKGNVRDRSAQPVTESEIVCPAA